MKVSLHEPGFGEEEIEAAVAQMRTTHVTMGKEVRKFEEQCAEIFDSKFSVMCNSGSSANLLALAALCNPAFPDYIKPGSEILVPALSWATTIWPVIQHGMTPVFIDCNLDTYNIDIVKLENAITEKTRAIMLVHVYGNPCDMAAIMELAKKYDLYVIEDCCEAMGATYIGRQVGSFGNIGTMSLYYSHHITTFEGGLCFTNDFHTAELLRILRAHGWSREADDKDKYVEKYPDIDPRFIFVNIGYNLRPTEVQAAIGMVQLPKLSKFVIKRRETHMAYRIRLNKYDKFFLFQTEQKYGYASWFGFGIVLKENTPFSLKDITSFLNRKGVETRPIIAGNIARHPALKMFDHRISGELSNCDTIMKRGFAIGCHPDITGEICDYVTQCIDEFLHDHL